MTLRNDTPVQSSAPNGLVHLGGSRVYGTPQHDSDVDMCLLLDPAQAALLVANAERARVGRRGCCFVRYGRLDLIVCTDAEAYRLWREGRDHLIAMRPVTKEQAIHTFTALGVSTPPHEMQDAHAAHLKRLATASRRWIQELDRETLKTLARTDWQGVVDEHIAEDLSLAFCVERRTEDTHGPPDPVSTLGMRDPRGFSYREVTMPDGARAWLVTSHKS